MISCLRGTVLLKEPSFAVIDVGGVGYSVHANTENLAGLTVESEAHLWTHMAVREQSLDLYGFLKRGDCNFFEKLISVSGIGPKSALAIMNLAPTTTLQSAIRAGDTTYLTKVSGIGKKMAQKIVLELKDTLEAPDGRSPAASEQDTDVLLALTALGYSTKVAREMLKEISPEIIGVEERVKTALAHLGSARE